MSTEQLWLCVDENDVLALLYDIRKYIIKSVGFSGEAIRFLKRIKDLVSYSISRRETLIMPSKVHKFIKTILKDFNLPIEGFDCHKSPYLHNEFNFGNFKDYVIVNETFKYSIYQVMLIGVFGLEFSDSIENNIMIIFENNKTNIKKLMLIYDSILPFFEGIDNIKKEILVIKKDIYLF